VDTGGTGHWGETTRRLREAPRRTGGEIVALSPEGGEGPDEEHQVR